MIFDPRSVTVEQLWDPSVTDADLATVASLRPDLWSAISVHPRVYPELQQWIAQQQAAVSPQPMSTPQVVASSQVQGIGNGAAAYGVTPQFAGQPGPSSESPIRTGHRKGWLVLLAVLVVMALVAGGGWF